MPSVVAVQPVYDRLERDRQTKAAIEQIRTMRSGAPSTTEAPRCSKTRSTTRAAGKVTPIDGVYRMTTTRKEAAEVFGDAPGDIASENYGRWKFVLDRGRLYYTQSSEGASRWTKAVYTVEGDTVAWRVTDYGGEAPNGAAEKTGEVYTFRWSRYRDQLTLTPVAGKISPANFRVKPWRRIGDAPKRRRRPAVAVLAAALALAVAGCLGSNSDKAGGAQHQKPVVLTMANGNGSPLELEPFAAAVARLSNNTVRIEFKNDWRQGSPSVETGVIRDVKAGKADLGWTGSRAFDSVGVRTLDALHAPLLIDSYALEQRVLQSPLVGDMLDGLKPLGVVGVGVLPGPMRKPLGVSPLVRPEDYRGKTIATARSRVAQQTLRALGASAKEIPVAGGIEAFDGVEQQVGAIDANEYDKVAKNLPPGNRARYLIAMDFGASRISSFKRRTEEHHEIRRALVIGAGSGVGHATAERAHGGRSGSWRPAASATPPIPSRSPRCSPRPTRTSSSSPRAPARAWPRSRSRAGSRSRRRGTST